MTTHLTLYLISDSTGDTVCNVARATLAQFENIEVEEQIHILVRSARQLEKIIEQIKENPGVVMYTILDKNLRDSLKEICRELRIPCISVLAKAVNDVAAYLNIKAQPIVPGRQHELDDDYFARINAINFTIAHDDGQATSTLNQADIILVGPSRTSKSPTSVYLAYKGYKTANVPFVLDTSLPETLFQVTEPLIVGLTIKSEALVEIRKNRLLSFDERRPNLYIEIDAIEEELREAKKLYARYRWPVIDVTRRSVEETAASIIQYYHKKNHSMIEL